LWQATDQLSPYVSYVESFGPNGGGFVQENGQQTPPSRGSQWEIGAKASLLNGRLTATLAYYDLTKTNIPTPDIFNPAFVTAKPRARAWSWTSKAR
jgi:iron complex outermembrane recepter protein